MRGVTTDEVVERRMTAPREDETLLLAVGHADCEDELADRIEADLGGTVEARLPFDTLRITLAETALEALCAVEGVESVEAEREVHLHDRGN